MKPVKPSKTRLLLSAGLLLIGVATGAAGIYIGDTDDAPGAALLGMLLMTGMAALAVRTFRHGRGPRHVRRAQAARGDGFNA